MDDVQLEFMSRSEVTFLHELTENWTGYGPAVKALAGLDGGMTWKTVNGAEYLCRYRQDPKTHKKKFASLGRRSAETERIYERKRNPVWVELLVQRLDSRFCS